MLHFIRMTLTNFGPYKGEQTIDFTDKSGVIIFWGNNGRGKTTLLNAFRFALFGKIQRRNGVLKHLKEMENTEAADAGQHGFKVVLEMTNDGDIYALTRQYMPRQGVTDPAGDEDYEKVTFLRKNGAILSPEDRDHELKVIMPEQVSRFFLFDAELLQEYEELVSSDDYSGEQIKNSIEKILGLPVLQNGCVDIEECLSKYEIQKTRAAKTDDRTARYGIELDSINANIKEHVNAIQEKKSQLSDLLGQKTVVEEQMKATNQLREWIIERNNAEKNLKSTEGKLVSVQQKLSALMKNAWKGMLLTTIRDMREKLETEEKVLTSKKQKRTVAESFIKEMKRAVADRTCPVCEQDIDSTIIAELQRKIKESSSEYSGLTEVERGRLYDIHSSLDTLRKLGVDVQDVRQNVKLLEDQKDQLSIECTEYKQQIAEMKDHISRYGMNADENDVLSITTRYSEIDQSIHDIRNGIDAENKKLNELKQQKDKITEAIDRSAGSTDYREASRRYELCDHIFKIFDESKAKYRDQLKANVQSDATELFLNLTEDPDYVRLQINDNYGLEIVHKSGRIVPGRSSGYEHVVALSLIGALHKNAPLQGPIIMDSPFGRLDPTHKANIIRTLPKMAEQSMLLAYTGEIDDQVARQELGASLLHEFKLERVTSMHTEIE